MTQAEVILPGGIRHDTRLHRIVRFTPITGDMEMRVSSRIKRATSRPEWVSNIIDATVDSIGDLPMTLNLAEGLCVADRHYILNQLALDWAGDIMWLSPVCEKCDELFDVRIQRSALTYKEAAQDFPYHTVSINSRQVTLRSPNGADQRWLCENRPANPIESLLSRCVVSVNEKDADAGLLKALVSENTAFLSNEIEKMGPCFQSRLNVPCPNCGYECPVVIDLCDLGIEATDIDEDIHVLAFYYHWSESDILSLTRQRRRQYIDRIDRERGCHA